MTTFFHEKIALVSCAYPATSETEFVEVRMGDVNSRRSLELTWLLSRDPDLGIVPWALPIWIQN